MQSYLQSMLSVDLWKQATLSLADIAAKGLLLLAIALLLTAFMRRSSAAKRHLVWALTFAGILLLPLLEAFTPDLRLGILPGKAPAAAEVQEAAPPLPTDVQPKNISAPDSISRAPELPIREMNARPGPSPTPPPSIPIPSQLPDAKPPLSLLIMIVWLAGVMATVTPLALGLFAISRVTRKAQPFAESRLDAIKESLTVELGIASRVSILRAAKCSMPMATGLRRPAILLPAEAREWPDEKSRKVLLHELAHVKRRDCLTQFIASLAVALHWCNPLAWWALRQMRIERERACDDLVLAAGERPSAYAEQLLQIAHETHAATLISVAAITMAKRSQLEGRLEAVLDPKRNRNRVKKWSIVLGVLLLAAIAVPLGMLKVGEHRAFANMTPEERKDFDVWRTQKLTFPPEALEIKTFSPEIIAKVRAFKGEWDREEAKVIFEEWRQSLDEVGRIPVPPNDFYERVAEKFSEVDALVSAFESVVTHPDYDFDVWTTTVSPSDRIPPRPDWSTIRCMVTLLQTKSGLMLEKGEIPAAIECAEALIMAARTHPYTIYINRMMGFSILKMAYIPWEKIIEETKDPVILDQTRARLRADLEQINLSLPPGFDWVAADNVGMIREAQRWGIEGSIQNKTGLELMAEASVGFAKYMRKYKLEDEPTIAKYEKSLTGIANPKGLISRWTSPIVAATMYSIALSGFERAERETQKLLSQFAALAIEPSTSQPTSTASIPDLVWGEEVDGLVAAVELRRVGLDPPTGNVGSESQPTGYTFAHGEAIDVRFRIKNVSDRTIRFSSIFSRRDPALLRDSTGRVISGCDIWYTAWPESGGFELKPGESVVLDNYDLSLPRAEDIDSDSSKPVMGNAFLRPPWDYTLIYRIRLSGREERDAKGNITFPRKGDWKGTLITAPVSITVVTDKTAAAKPQHAFAMYEVLTPVYPVNEEGMRKMDLEQLALSDKPFLTDEDIVSYEWPTQAIRSHAIRLKPEVRERIVSGRGDPWAIGFVVIANGERIYYGELQTFMSAYAAHSCPTIANFGMRMANNKISINPGLKVEGSRAGAFDDPKIKAALGGKLELLRPPKTQHAFAMYKVLTPVVPADEQQMRNLDLDKLELASGPFLTDEDIVSYEWETHIIHLKPGVRERIMPNPIGVPLQGLPFVLVANDERIYLGAFWTSISSFLSHCPTIEAFNDGVLQPDGTSIKNAIRISGGGPIFRGEPNDDPRLTGVQDPRIKAALGDKITKSEMSGTLNPTTMSASAPATQQIGRKVKGRLVDPNHESFDYISLKASIAPETPGFFLDQDGKWPEGEQHSQFLSSPAGKPYTPYVRILRDGNFEIDSVLPARYELRIFIPGAQSADGKMKTLKTHKFEVLSYDLDKQLAQGSEGELDLGTLTIHVPDDDDPSLDTSMLLRDMLRSPDELARAEALQKVGADPRIARNDKQVLDALIKAMSDLGDPSFGVQYAANQAMAQVGPVNIAAIRAVIRAVRANADKFSATGAYTGPTAHIVPTSQFFFAKLNDTHAYAIPDFVSLAKDPQVGVQRVAVEALIRIGTVPPELGPMLIEQLKKEQHVWAEMALKKMGPEAAPYVPELIGMLKQKYWASKTAAARVLAAIGRPAADPAIPILEAFVKTADDPQGTLSASLLKLDPQSQAALDRLEILATTPNAPDPTSCSYARGLLIKYGRNVEQHTQALVEALNDSNLRTRAVAVKMILENSTNKEARQAAREQAERIRNSDDADDRTVQIVLQGLQSADKPLDKNP